MMRSPIFSKQPSDAGHGKVYVPVDVTFDADGNMRPYRVRWEDGEVYEIDRVRQICRSAALHAGGHGDRYEVEICGQVTYLFFEHALFTDSATAGRWFAERKRSV